jgi:outer membrane protein
VESALKNRYVLPILTVLAMASWTAASPAVAAELKLGYVDAVRLLEEAPQARDATKRLKEEFAPREDEIAKMSDQVKKMEDALARDGAVMSETERRNQGLDVMSRKRELRRLQEEFREDVNIRRNDALSGLQDLIKETIQEVGSAGGYDLIFFEGIAYANSKLDITDEILKGLTKRYQASAAPGKR